MAGGVEMSEELLESLAGRVEADERKVVDKLKAELRRRVERGQAELRKRVERGRGAWRKVVTGSEEVRVRDHFRERIREPTVVRLKDKVSFMVGVVLGLLVSEWLLVVYPALFGLWFAAVIPSLCIARYFMYRQANFQYFLADFCYLVQILCLVALVLPRSYATFHAAVFALANGPLLWAIPTWRCSMVFHSLDKVTSVFIHAFPALLTFTHHWYTPIPDGTSFATAVTSEWATYNVVARRSVAMISFTGWMVVPLAIYVAWQVAYLWKTEVADKARLDADPTLTTSLRWLTRDSKNPAHKLVLAILRRLGVMGPDELFDPSALKTKLIFVSVQLVYTILTILPVVFLYSSFVVHITLLIVLLAYSLWNGSAYYFDVFTKRYEAKFVEGAANALTPPPGAESGAESKSE